MSEENYQPETLAVRAGTVRSQFHEHSEAMFSPPVSPSTAQPSRSALHRPRAGHIYARFTNPTVTMFEERLAAMEGAEQCIATASGMSAILACCMGLLQSGDHIVASRSLFGATVNLFGGILKKFGIATTFVSATDVSEWSAAARPGNETVLSGNAIQSAHRNIRHRGDFSRGETVRRRGWRWITASAPPSCNARWNWARIS